MPGWLFLLKMAPRPPFMSVISQSQPCHQTCALLSAFNTDSPSRTWVAAMVLPPLSDVRRMLVDRSSASWLVLPLMTAD